MLKIGDKFINKQNVLVTVLYGPFPSKSKEIYYVTDSYPTPNYFSTGECIGISEKDFKCWVTKLYRVFYD